MGLLKTVLSQIAPGNTTQVAKCSLSKSQLARVSEYIDAHLAHPIGLQDLARVSDTKMRTFSEAFRNSLGMTPYAYVLQRRIDKARDLIVSTDTRLIDIAYTCGFSSQAHMTSAFGKLIGATPGQLRTNAR